MDSCLVMEMLQTQIYSGMDRWRRVEQEKSNSKGTMYNIPTDTLRNFCKTLR